jgi:hypothetical protein
MAIENPIYVFLFWELRGRSLYFHTHVSVSDLYNSQDRQIDLGNIKIAHRHMNVEIGTVAEQFLFWEYLL